jgi:hypothetical protein
MADRPHRRRDQAPKIAFAAHEVGSTPQGPATHYARLKSRVNAASIRWLQAPLLDASADYGHKQSQHDAKATHLYDFVRHHSGLANKLARVVLLLTISSSSFEH